MEWKNLKSGWLTIGSKRYFYRSGFEIRWAVYLQFLKEAGAIQEWHYEPDTFFFDKIKSGVRQYKPDFRIIEGGETIYHECKSGYMAQKAVTKLRRMSIYYPDEKIVLVVDKVPKKYNKFKANIDKARKYVIRILEANTISWFKCILGK